METEERLKSHFPLECAPEIERALLAGLWHEPDRLPETMRWLSPNAHLSQPSLRLVLEAISRCYSELGAADFATVVECLRELGYLAECGGIEALDELYEACWYPPLWHLYGDFLRDLALRRAGEPHSPAPFFSGGSGCLSLNLVRKTELHPLYIGTARIRGHNYSIRGWSRGKEAGVELKFIPL
jgi:hypothetical protein